MEKTSDFKAYLQSDGGAVVFPVSAGGREVRCSISRDALEQFFWLPAEANEARVVKAFSDGRGRVFALAVRMALRAKSDTLALTAADFER
ncbi:hypothetical protein SBC1_26230 [Caballeronia sp. SBC1]|uniref:DUF1488 family protein n=1 Tax=Caballeronia sp. SBC1 TaxID=2705548 RepID=UPI00140CBE42|nr:DUF1488 family protein [Caballeronia sp. SBC1]QIN62607.1 hypothetical protein SBC1_26230 [Caballeronia sp. SBC1]